MLKKRTTFLLFLAFIVGSVWVARANEVSPDSNVSIDSYDHLKPLVRVDANAY